MENLHLGLLTLHQMAIFHQMTDDQALKILVSIRVVHGFQDFLQKIKLELGTNIKHNFGSFRVDRYL